VVIASGGNAGLAAANAARHLGVKCTVFAHSSTEPAIYKRMEQDGATVDLSHGGWEQVDAAAHKFAEAEANRAYVHPFIGEPVVVGHVSLVDEVYEQLPLEAAERQLQADSPDVVTCAVGGGGLIRGIMRGLDENAKRMNIPSAHLVGIQALGGDAWVRSLETEDDFVTLDSPYSIANSLVCKASSTEAVRDARHYASTGHGGIAPDDIKGRAGTYPTVVRIDDAQAGAAAWKSSEAYGQPIELSCGVAMVPAYQPAILDVVQGKLNTTRLLHVVLVACGGSRVDEDTNQWHKEQFGDGYGDVYVDGCKVALGRSMEYACA